MPPLPGCCTAGKITLLPRPSSCWSHASGAQVLTGHKVPLRAETAQPPELKLVAVALAG
ncbi:MAG: hypothetical protein U1E47_01615 [Rivihabitans pingtungensis]